MGLVSLLYTGIPSESNSVVLGIIKNTLGLSLAIEANSLSIISCSLNTSIR